MFKRVNVIVLDSVGIGEAPDAADFGDQGTHTLGHIIEKNPNANWQNLLDLGLANIEDLPPLKAVDQTKANYGKMQEVSVGKDTMTGHWEIMGLNIQKAFQVFPEGFPEDFLKKIEDYSGRKVICNLPYSGTEVIKDYGQEQLDTGALIIYTSADPVLQVAAHEDVIPLEELYDICQYIRSISNEPPVMIGRIIARPFTGQAGAFERNNGGRHDYALEPFGKTVLDSLKEADYDVLSVGKINDIFSGNGITESHPTKSNLDGIKTTINLLKRDDWQGLTFTNLVDFDAVYGHRRDPEGYAKAIEEFDHYLPDIMAEIGDDDLLIITADHGNDPTAPGTDHTREYVPLLVYSPKLAGNNSLGIRKTYADIAASLADNFDLDYDTRGQSFMNDLK
ncbi:phosphopentomutase [Aerococcus kribbianus]|uniref:Phosphopentomutase n=1 Tax=Aerococcus kribbianus TaxID=2999064 RepID=A0A9X3FPU8_9LACT|nr:MULTISPECIES: phosphopentomutase [unclassified Aerococcus]MCZ0717361.1 phosphopentomutase [Aerococcus sp. YH-aer221]MCZ0725649.1 phosphopentomutase [Aerococcus sp. YH-aer222]